MKPKTLTALKQSIKHWERLNRCDTPDKLEIEGWGVASCALCDLFYDKGLNCDGCPVSKKTGVSYCGHTPYQKADTALDYFAKRFIVSQPKAETHAMINFLKGLLPNKK